MADSTTGVKIGCIAGLLGGVIAIALMAIYFEPAGDIIPVISFYMLISALFFASAGAYAKNSQWDAKVTALIAFLNMAVIILAALYGSMSLNVAIVLAIFGSILLLVPSMPSVKVWLNNKL